MKKSNLLEKIKSVDLSNEEKTYLINLVNTNKKYGLVWEDKPEDVEDELRSKLPVLKEVKKRAVVNDTSDKMNPNHLLIEGDNLHSLTALTFTHEGRIDAVYGDPPYNTGNNTWKYNNNYIDEEDPFRHSKWISFMEKRLKIIKKLLTPDGIVCLTIDNYEVHNLRHLMEEIFDGKEIIITVIEHNFRGRAKNNFALTNEYALWAVPKGKESITRLKEKSGDISRNLRRTGQGSRRHESPTMFYGIEVNKKTLEIVSVSDIIPIGEKEPKTNSKETEYVWPIDNDGLERRWYYGIDTTKKEIKNGKIWAKVIRGRIEIHYWKAGKEKRRKSVWSGPKYDGSTHGSELLTEIIGENDFPFPKSIFAVQECLEAMTNEKDAIILDFFSGSGTTGHAVMKMNAQDGGNRQFIMCTNNENNICEEITYQRSKNVIQGYKFKGDTKTELFNEKVNVSFLKKAEKTMEKIESLKKRNKKKFDSFKLSLEQGRLVLIGIKSVDGIKEGLNNNNLRYFKTEFIDRKPSLSNKRKLTQLATELICIKEDCFVDVTSSLIKEKNWLKIYADKMGNYLCIIYEDDQIQPAIHELKKFISKTILNRPISVYVFSNGQYPYTEEFEDILDSITLCAIPDAIYKALKNVLPNKQKMFVPELEEDVDAENGNGEIPIELLK